MLLLFASCSSAGDSLRARAAAESAERLVRPGMTVSGVVDVAVATNQDFSVLGLCGSRALNVRGAGGDIGLVAWRGSPSGGAGLFETAPEDEEQRFKHRSQLRAAIEGSLLKGEHCSTLFVGFSGPQSWRFEVALSSDGRVAEVKPSQLWQ